MCWLTSNLSAKQYMGKRVHLLNTYSDGTAYNQSIAQQIIFRKGFNLASFYKMWLPMKHFLGPKREAIFQKEKNFKIDAMNVKTTSLQWEVLWKMGAFFLACWSSTLATVSVFNIVPFQESHSQVAGIYVNCQLSILRISILSRGGIDLNVAFLSSPLETSTLITKQLTKLRKWRREEVSQKT